MLQGLGPLAGFKKNNLEKLDTEKDHKVHK